MRQLSVISVILIAFIILFPQGSLATRASGVNVTQLAPATADASSYMLSNASASYTASSLTLGPNTTSLPALVFSPSSGPPGIIVNLCVGSGSVCIGSSFFPSPSDVGACSITANPSSLIASVGLCTISVNSYGVYLEGAAFIVASTATPGPYTVTVKGSSGDSISGVFTVSSLNLILQPTSGPVGTVVTVAGSGFASNDIACQVTSTPSSLVTNSGPCIVSNGQPNSQSASSGVLTPFTFTVGNVAPGSYVIQVKGTANFDVAQTTFTVSGTTTMSSSTISSASITSTASYCEINNVAYSYPHQALPNQQIQVDTIVSGSCASNGDYYAVRVDLMDELSNAIISSNSTPIGYNANDFNVTTQNHATTPSKDVTWPLQIQVYVIRSASNGAFLLVYQSTGDATIQVSASSSVTVQSSSTSSYGPGGGAVAGYVLGLNACNQFEPLTWASVIASNVQSQFVAYSGSGGYYDMFVPAGSYNVTVVEPGYKPYSSTVSVSFGSASTINFYLEQVPVAGTSTGTTTVTLTSCFVTTTASSVSSTFVPILTTTVTATTTVTLTMSSTGSAWISSGTTYLQISSNSTISNLLFDSQRRLINFTVNGPSGTTGVTSLVFAKSLINGVPLALIDNGSTLPISESFTSNSTHYFLTFAYHHTTHSITVGGSGTIPEFGGDPAPTIFMILAISLIFVRRRSRLANKKQ